MTAPRIDILLATFRGERWLPAQLDSLLAQTHTNWRVIARDDGSDDATRAVLDTYAGRHPERFLILPADGQNLGAKGNFSALMGHSTADYAACCDQDDVWHPERLARGLAAIQAAERELPADTPVLAHGDLRVVDADLALIAASYAQYQGLDLRRGSFFQRLLIQNVICGNTLTMNRALVTRAHPVPHAAIIMHDWWLGLVASALGRCLVVDGEPLINYRQHGRNTIGAERFSFRGALRRFKRWWPGFVRANLIPQKHQAHAFYERYANALPTKHREELAAFLELFDAGYLRRRSIILRYGFWRHHWTRSLELFVRI